MNALGALCLLQPLPPEASRALGAPAGNQLRRVAQRLAARHVLHHHVDVRAVLDHEARAPTAVVRYPLERALRAVADIANLRARQGVDARTRCEVVRRQIDSDSGRVNCTTDVARSCAARVAIVAVPFARP